MDKKRVIENSIKVVAFVLVFLAGLTGLYHYFRWKDTSGNYLSSVDSYYAIADQDRVDVLFVGPSFAYCAINPAYLWDESGISSFAMTISGMDSLSAIAHLREVCKTQTPEVVFIDCYSVGCDEYAIEANVYRNTINEKLTWENMELIRELVDEEGQMDYLLRWPIVHTRYKELQRYDFEQYMPSIYTLGHMYAFEQWGTTVPTRVPITEGVTPISEKNRQYVDACVQLAEEQQFSLVFYYPPVCMDERSVEILKGVEDYTQELGIPLIRLNDYARDIKLDYATDFIDSGHTNESGSEKIMSFFQYYLDEYYTLEDHRGESGYEPWEKASLYRRHILLDRSIELESDVSKKLELIGTLDQATIALYQQGDTANSMEKKEMLWEILQLPFEEYREEGAWMIQDGKITGSLDTQIEGRLIAKVNSADTLSITKKLSEEDKWLYTTMLGQTVIQPPIPNVAGLYIVVYDKLTDRVVCNSFIQ